MNIFYKSKVCFLCKKNYVPTNGRQIVCANCKKRMDYMRQRTWLSNNPTKSSEYSKKYKLKNLNKIKEKDRVYSKKRRLFQKDKCVARDLVRIEVRAGRIKKPKNCELCKNKAIRIEAHHYLGYEKEHWLDIQWLCIPCHKQLHKKYAQNFK